MTVTPTPPSSSPAAAQPAKPLVAPLTITWEKLPADYKLDDKPVDNLAQPLLAAALRESLEIAGPSICDRKASTPTNFHNFLSFLNIPRVIKHQNRAGKAELPSPLYRIRLNMAYG
jgi:hypothetical protein